MQNRRCHLLCFFALFCVCGCKAWSRDDVARLPSPNGKIDAVLVESNGGAATSFGYEVSLLPHGQAKGVEVARLYGAVRNDTAWGVDLLWQDDTHLDIDYLRAEGQTKILQTAAVGGKHILITLRPGIRNAGAPSGGMLYNLRKQPAK